MTTREHTRAERAFRVLLSLRNSQDKQLRHIVRALIWSDIALLRKARAA